MRKLLVFIIVVLSSNIVLSKPKDQIKLIANWNIGDSKKVVKKNYVLMVNGSDTVIQNVDTTEVYSIKVIDKIRGKYILEWENLKINENIFKTSIPDNGINNLKIQFTIDSLGNFNRIIHSDKIQQQLSAFLDYQFDIEVDFPLETITENLMQIFSQKISNSIFGYYGLEYFENGGEIKYEDLTNYKGDLEEPLLNPSVNINTNNDSIVDIVQKKFGNSNPLVNTPINNSIPIDTSSQSMSIDIIQFNINDGWIERKVSTKKVVNGKSSYLIINEVIVCDLGA